jgi:hypothetical protein
MHISLVIELDFKMVFVSIQPNSHWPRYNSHEIPVHIHEYTKMGEITK